LNDPRPSAWLERAGWMLLLLFVFSIPWEKSVWIPHVGTIARLLGILAFAAGVVVAVRRASVRIPNVALLLATLFALWSAMTFFWSLDRHETARCARTVLELTAMLWLIWDECRGPVRQRQIMHAWVLGAVAAAAIAFYRYLHHWQNYYQRYAATGFDPNDFGLILALSIPIALYLGLRERRWIQGYLYGAVLAFICAVLLTASRTALVASFVAFGFCILTWQRCDFAQRIAIATLAAALILGLFQYAPAPQRRRLATIPNEVRQATFHDRTRIWKAGLIAFKSHVVAGVGSCAYPEAVRPTLGRPDAHPFQFVAHNTLLSVMVETGVIGFAIYLLVIASLVLFIWMMPFTERALWSVVLASWAVGAAALTWEHHKPSWLIMALIMTEWARSVWPARDGP
jgi:O-antigen ligase